MPVPESPVVDREPSEDAEPVEGWSAAVALMASREDVDRAPDTTPFARWEAAKKHASEGQRDDAIDELRQTLDDGFAVAGLTLGTMLREDGDEAGAEAAYADAARLATSPSTIAAARLNQGLCCEHRGDNAAARECYERAIAQDASAAATAQLMLDALKAHAATE